VPPPVVLDDAVPVRVILYVLMVKYVYIFTNRNSYASY